MEPRRRLTMVNMLSHDWLCGRVDVPATPLMTPDILDMSGSHVGTALRVAMNAYHKAARAGFTLMDVSNAPLAKRRKKKNFSSESQKGSDDSTDTNTSKPDTQTVSKEDNMTSPERGSSEKKSSVESSTHGNIPALAVCLSPSSNKQSVIDTVATSREPPPLRPISSDYECLLSGNSSSSTESNFFFKEFYDSSSAQAYSHYGHNHLSSSNSGSVLRHYAKNPDLTSQKEHVSVFNQKHAVLHRGPLDTGEGCIPTQGPGAAVLQRGHEKSQYTCSATKQSRTNESDVVNNNIIDIALSGLREGNRSRKRQYPP